MRPVPKRKTNARPGRVTATLGRRVVVTDDEGERMCFLSGHRAVIGDRVTWEEARGEGGKIVDVLPRERALERTEMDGREHVLAANLGGLLVVAAATHPTFRPGLIDRYMVAASTAGFGCALVLTKIDLGVADEVAADLDWREAQGMPAVRCCPKTGEGVDDVLALLRANATMGPWALVGHSGVGKTALAQALLPGVDVGPIGDVSEFWEQGRHTTTGSRILTVEPGVELADSPGIRTFLPGRVDAIVVRDHFPGVGPLTCRYRDCLHRPGEDGCVAESTLPADLVVRYRRVLDEVVGIQQRNRP